MNYKEIVQSYLEFHYITPSCVNTIKDKLRSCSTNKEVYHRISQLGNKATFDNCFLKGFKNYEPNRELELVCDDILRELDKLK